MDRPKNNAPPLAAAAAESHFLQDLRRDLPKKLYQAGFATTATAVGGLVKQLVAASARSRHAAEDVPLSQLTQFFLLVNLFGGLSTIYAARRVEMEDASSPRRWRKAGVPIYFFCLLLLVAAVSLVGSDYSELALNFIDN